jgi:DNA-binding PadR family transcriptional regulator
VQNLSPKEYLVLDLLRAGGQKYGLEMVRESSGLKRGTIYVLLDRMTDKGLVSSVQEKSPSQPGLPRRLYSITGQGAVTLRAQEAFAAEMANSLAWEVGQS